MALKQITPVPVRVRWDRASARPATLRLGDRSLAITGLKSMRDEMAAYPATRGPRVTFVVNTDAGEASLVYDCRRRRWYVEALDQAA